MYKIAHPTSVYNTYCLGHWNEENERSKTSNWIDIIFQKPLLTFYKLECCTFMYDFCVRGKFWSKYHNWFGIYQTIPSIPLRATTKQTTAK